MFKGLGEFTSILKNAQQIGGRLKEMGEELKNLRAVGSAGGGMVEIDVNGAGDVLACRIDPHLVEQRDGELLEDLVAAAVNDASQKAKQLQANAMKSATGGMELPGLEEALAKLTGGTPPSDSA